MVSSELAALQSLIASHPGYTKDQLTELVSQAQKMVNERIYERAKAVLTPQQLAAFGAYQTKLLEANGP
jgi:hypothetical protein